MQKQLRLDILARNHAIKHKHKRLQKEARDEWQGYFQNRQEHIKHKNQAVREEKLWRRQDWLAGPLAPNRDAGRRKGLLGTVDQSVMAQGILPEFARTTPKKSGYDEVNWEKEAAKSGFKGNTIVGNVILNDRVAIVHGPSRLRGLVGVVKAIDPTTETVTLTNINSADMNYPPAAAAAQLNSAGEAPLFETMEIPIPTTWVRLICNIPDPTSGLSKPVIVRHVHAAGPYVVRDPYSNWPAHHRYATGTEHLTSTGRPLRIDWPAPTSDQAPVETDVDTGEADFKELTWKPVVSHSPLCYTSYPRSSSDQLEDPAERFTAGAVKDRIDASNEQRAGIHGFASEQKLRARQYRISTGIAAELMGAPKKASKTALTDRMKEKLLQDARAIWWQERSIVSPTTEAMQMAADQKKQLRESRIQEFKARDVQQEQDHGDTVGDHSSLFKAPSHQSRLPQSIEHLVTEMQQVTIADRYVRPEKRLLNKVLAETRSRADSQHLNTT